MSEPLHLRYPAVTAAALEREIARELEHRRSYYPARVAKGRMLQAEADRQLALAEAWFEDVGRIRQCWIDQWSSSSDAVGPRGAFTPPAPPAHAFSWQDRRNGVLRELDLRRRFYPEWIDSGRLTRADAAHQLQCLECLLALYEGGWDWRGSDGLTPFHSPTADAEFTALHVAIAQREGQAQEEMDLT